MRHHGLIRKTNSIVKASCRLECLILCWRKWVSSPLEECKRASSPRAGATEGSTPKTESTRSKSLSCAAQRSNEPLRERVDWSPCKWPPSTRTLASLRVCPCRHAWTRCFFFNVHGAIKDRAPVRSKFAGDFCPEVGRPLSCHRM